MSAEIIKNNEVSNFPSVDVVGGKGLGLLKLKELSSGRDFEVPDFYIIPVGYKYTEENLRELYELIDGPLAVRSSSPYEDSEGLSFAGRFESVLNINDFESFKESIQKVLESANNEKAKTYAEQHGISIDNKMAVVVQKMVNPHYSGVCYSSSNTENPKTIIEYGCGLSEGILSGDRQGYLASFNGNDLVIEHGQAFDGLTRIANVARELEQIYGKKLDIEFAIERCGKLCLVQARPITDPNWEKIELPEIDESTLLLNADVVRGSGNFTGPAFVFRSPDALDVLARKNNKRTLIESIVDQEYKLKDFDEKNINGYCLIADTLQEHQGILDLKLKNIKALVTVDYASRFSHPLKVVSEAGVFYLGVLGRIDLMEKIKTGDVLSVVSDQSKGFIFDLVKNEEKRYKPEKFDLEDVETIKLDEAMKDQFPNWEKIDEKLILSSTGKLGVYFWDYNEKDGVPSEVFYNLISVEHSTILFHGEYRDREAMIPFRDFPSLLVSLIMAAKTKERELYPLPVLEDSK